MDEDPVDAIGEAASDVSQSNAFKECMFIVLYSFNFIARQIVGPPPSRNIDMQRIGCA